MLHVRLSHAVEFDIPNLIYGVQIVMKK